MYFSPYLSVHLPKSHKSSAVNLTPAKFGTPIFSISSNTSSTLTKGNIYSWGKSVLFRVYIPRDSLFGLYIWFYCVFRLWWSGTPDQQNWFKFRSRVFIVVCQVRDYRTLKIRRSLLGRDFISGGCARWWGVRLYTLRYKNRKLFNIGVILAAFTKTHSDYKQHNAIIHTLYPCMMCIVHMHLWTRYRCRNSL